MFRQIQRLLKTVQPAQYIRNISKNVNAAKQHSYEGEGKTTIHILNDETDLGLMINGFSEVGFRLNNEMTVLGPMIIFPRSVLAWNINDINDVCEESLSIFTVLEPRLEIVVLGIGDPADDLTFYRRLLEVSKKFRINFEILPTQQACATFNFLNSESRYVAGALIPPMTINPTEDDVLKSKMRYERLYETDEFWNSKSGVFNIVHVDT